MSAVAPPDFGPGMKKVRDDYVLALIHESDEGRAGDWRISMSGAWTFAATALDDSYDGVVAYPTAATILQPDDDEWQRLYREGRYTLGAYSYVCVRGGAA